MILYLFISLYELGYGVQYGPLYGGDMILRVERDTIINKDTCFVFKSILNSNKDLKFLFDVNDTVISIVRKRDFSTLVYEEHIHERNYTRDKVVNFSDSSFEKPVYDMLSIFFIFYSGKEKLDIDKTVNILYKDSILQFHIFPVQKKKIKTRRGIYNTVLFSPDVKNKKAFGSKGKLSIYYNENYPNIPIKIKTHMFIGSVDATLKWLK